MNMVANAMMVKKPFDINSGSYKTIVTNMARLEGLSRAENKHLKLIGHAFIIKIHD